MFDVERFVEDCKRAVIEGDDHRAVRELVARAVAEPGEVAHRRLRAARVVPEARLGC